MNIPREFIDLLLAKLDLVDLIHSRIPLQKKSSNNYFARCPFHREKSASFSVSQPKQFYYCFGCGAHGNAIDFMMQHDQLSFPEAIETLARWAGMEIPGSAHPSQHNQTQTLYDLMNKVSEYYYEQMRKSERAIMYLKNRGISGLIAQQFHLGYAHNSWNHLGDHLGKTHEDKKNLLDAGLLIKKETGSDYDRFRDRIMFPIHDHRGRIIGFGGRILDQGEPKYLNSPETTLFQKGHELYGLYQALKINRHLERIIIVEGYMDVIALFQHDMTYAVATLGTATTLHHLQRLFRYTRDLIFCFDGDKAGRTAAWRALQVIFPLMGDDLQIRFLFLPDGEDPDSLIRKEGKTCFEERIQKAHPLSTFFFEGMSTQCDMGTMEGRARFASLSLNYIHQLPKGLFRSILLEELSKRARLDLRTLKQQTKLANEPTKHDLPETNMKLATPLRLAMTLLIQHPELAEQITSPIPNVSLSGFVFFTELLEVIKKSPHITTGALKEHFRGHDYEPMLVKLASYDHFVPEAGLKNALLGAFRQLQVFGLDEEINRFLAKAANFALSEEEKLELSMYIAKKKAILKTG